MKVVETIQEIQQLKDSSAEITEIANMVHGLYYWASTNDQDAEKIGNMADWLTSLSGRYDGLAAKSFEVWKKKNLI